MNPIISEDKRNILRQMINRIEEELSNFSTKLEDNTSVSEEEWNQYEAVIDKLYLLLNQLKEEI